MTLETLSPSIANPNLARLTLPDIDAYVARTHNDIYSEDGSLHYLVTDGLLQATPLVPTVNARVWAKLETAHSIKVDGQELVLGAFKCRGAYVATARAQQRNPWLTGTVAATQGNHGLGVAAAAYALGIECDIYTPYSLNPVKRAGMELLGARIHSDYDSLKDALNAAESAVDDDPNRVFLHPFDNLDVASGQGTIGAELAYQLKELDAAQHPNLRQPTLSAVALGGGGLLTGVAVAAKHARESDHGYGFGVVAAHLKNKELSSWSDGTAAALGKLGSLSLHDSRYTEGYVTVTEPGTATSLLRVKKEEGRTLEPAGAQPHAAVEIMLEDPTLANYRFVVVESGQNLSTAGHQRAIELAAR